MCIVISYDAVTMMDEFRTPPFGLRLGGRDLVPRVALLRSRSCYWKCDGLDLEATEVLALLKLLELIARKDEVS